MSRTGVCIGIGPVDAAALAALWAEEDAALAAFADRDGPPSFHGADDFSDNDFSDDDFSDEAPPLVGAAGPLESDESGDTGKIDALVELERLRSWVDARTQRVLASLAPDPLESADKHWVRDEIACALRQSANYVTLRLHIARELTDRLPDTLALLERGAISPRHAEVLALAVLPLDDATTAAVQRQVLRRAGQQTITRFAAAVRRAVDAADPRSAADRHARATRDRRVGARAAEDGMGDLYAHLRLDELAQVMDTLDAAARATRHARAQPAGDRTVDTRTLDQLRADALVDLVLGRAVPRAYAAQDSEATDTPTDTPTASTPDPASDPAPDERAPVVLPRPGRIGVQVVVNATTLLGLDDQPAEIDGYGPIPAGLARLLANDPTARWRRLLTDPTTGRLLDYGRTTYRPPADLSGHVRARDRTCRFPGCNRRAAGCETDHLIAWEDGGRTDRDNCQALCPRHHHLKHEAGWQVVGDPADELRWTSPTGHTYRSPPGSYEPGVPVDDPPPF